MYTDSIDSESKFLTSLWLSHDIKMDDGEVKVVGECPKCHKGNVLTRCIQEIKNGEICSWRFEHYCDCCGEKFIPSDISADIFFNKTHEMLEKLETPFGDIHVKINGRVVPFRYRKEIYKDEVNSPGKPVITHIIDIDFSELEEGDIAFCGFDNKILEYNDSDERAVLHSCESDTQILGIGAYEPDDDKIYCYQLEDYDGDGFRYRVISDPTNFDEHHFLESKFATLSVAVLNKDDYSDSDLVLSLALI